MKFDGTKTFSSSFINYSTKKKETKSIMQENKKIIVKSSDMQFRGATVIRFNSQLGRDKLKTTGTVLGPHESRFSYLSKPCKVLGSYHRVKTPDFSKTMARDSKSMYYSNMILRDYSPSYLESVHSACIIFLFIIAINFSKILPRPSSTTTKLYPTSESYSIEDLNKGFQILGHVRKSKLLSMKQMMPRDDKMYCELESSINNKQKELRKYKRLFGSIIGEKLMNKT